MYAASITVACLHFIDAHALNVLIIIKDIDSTDSSHAKYIIRCNYFVHLSNNLNTSITNGIHSDPPFRLTKN